MIRIRLNIGLKVIKLMMLGAKKGESPYLTHNWCTKCEEWRIGKPTFCPECNRRCRVGSHYSNGRYLRKDVKRIG